jgi:hypothetical protein
LLAFAALSVAISWPLARDFTTALTGAGLDALSHLWGVWHTAQALLGREPLFSTSLLFYPDGISLLLHSAGPLPGLLALPFWPLGPVAAYNGGLLVGLTLTGAAMFALARDLGCSRPAALLAGIILITAPAHLVGLRGQLAKVFLGLLPIAFIALRRALADGRPRRWAAAFGLALLLLMLHSPLQFIQMALFAPIVAIAAVAASADRRATLRRTLWAGAAAVALAGPLVAATAAAAANPAIAIDRSGEAMAHQPDAMQLALPPSFSRAFGAWTAATLTRQQIAPRNETEVAIPAAAVLLIAAAAVGAPRRAAVWLAIAGGGVLLSLGATLRLAGHDSGVPLPYAWVSSLPGLDFFGTPARFMQIAFVGIAAAAAMGVDAAARARPRRAAVIAFAGGALVLLEVWPAPWPTQRLPEVPGFYRALARDPDPFGVFDLPIRPRADFSAIDYSARYQLFQMTHGKGIAAGSISRTYDPHPIAPCLYAPDRLLADVRVNGTPSPCEPAAVYQLARNGYRYVVWHEPFDGSGEGGDDTYGAHDSARFVAAAFDGRPPDISDGRVRAWSVPPGDRALPATPVLELGTGWYPAEPRWRWARSPATLRVTAAAAASAELAIDVALLHGLGTPVGLSPDGVLIVTAGGETQSIAVGIDRIARVPVRLARGVTDIVLTLGAGNFRPTDYAQTDARTLSFAVRAVDLVVATAPRTLEGSSLLP